MLARLLAFVLACPAVYCQTGNQPQRLEWFRDLGFGMFIHWGVDVNLGAVISHSLAGASEDYVRRYYAILPRYFHPTRFEPRKWAALARLAGMKYMVFTAKHHSGFAMWDTQTTRMNVMQTPLGRDVVKEVIAAFRAEGIAIGLYISPDDFHWFHTNGLPIARPPAPKTTTKELPELLAYGKAQLKELLTQYGKIDLLFIDGPADGLREYAWQSDPSIVVTRGAIETPEQTIPEITLDQPWEACLTMGTAWQHKPTNESYIPAGEWILRLIEIRAKGGNLLLNVGPTPDGEIYREEEARLREIALWNFVNGEAIEAVRPWVVEREGDVWFTRKRTEPTVYAFVTGKPLALGERKEIVLRSVRASARTEVSVLGHGGRLLEYKPEVDARTIWKQEPAGLRVSFIRGQRLYDNRRWPNPIVLKITHAEPAYEPPEVVTHTAAWKASNGCHLLEGELRRVGSSSSVAVSFQYRKRRGLADLYEPADVWKDVPPQNQAAPGKFTHCLAGVPKEGDYEFRAVVRHTLGVRYGKEVPFQPQNVVKLH